MHRRAFIVIDSIVRRANRAAPLWVLAVGLLAAIPLLEPRLIHASDSLPHYYTLVQLDHLVRQGIVYTRWIPYKASGFGAPFFQYYAPLAFYAAEGFVWLGLEMLLAFRLAWALTLVGSAVGAYLWTRDILHEGPALVAAAAYVCGPYMLDKEGIHLSRSTVYRVLNRHLRLRPKGRRNRLRGPVPRAKALVR